MFVEQLHFSSLAHSGQFQVAVNRVLMTLAFTMEVEPVMKAIQITLDDNLHRKAKALAYRIGTTLAGFVRRAVEDRVERIEEPNAVVAPEGRVQ